MNVTPQEIALAIVRFLKEDLESADHPMASKESLEIAVDCICKAYGIEKEDPKMAADIVALVSRSKAIFDPKLADKYRLDGNNLMAENKHEEALEAYDKAIQHDPSNHVHYGNRSVAYLKLKRFVNAVEDANTSININPQFHRGHARKGIALMALEEYFEAKRSLEKALELDPDNQVYTEKLNQCKAKIEESNTEDQSNNPMAGLAGLLNNPAFMNMTQNLMSNPQVQQAMSGMAQSFTNPEAGFDFNSMMQACQNAFANLGETNPELFENLRNLNPDDPDNQNP